MKNYKRVKANNDRGYVSVTDKIRVFMESGQKVMYVDTSEYGSIDSARGSYRHAIQIIRARGMVRVAVNRGDVFLIRNDI